MFNTRLLIPSGPCPAILTGTSLGEVEDWISHLKQRKPENFIYEPSVYRYWAQKFFAIGSEEYQEVDLNITKILKSKDRIGDLVEKNTQIYQHEKR